MKKLLIFSFFVLLNLSMGAQDHNHDDHGHAHEEAGHADCGHHGDPKVFDATGTAFHHIADANVYSIGPLNIPLPCILYRPGHGLETFMSSVFTIGHHGDGANSHNGWVLDAGTVKRVADAGFPSGDVAVDGFSHETVTIDGKDKVLSYVCQGGSKFKIENKSTLDAGLFGGGITSFYDFSITKNVVAIIIVIFLLFWVFLTIAKAYKVREGKAPTGMQNFFESIYEFIQEEVAKPFLGVKYMKYQPFLMSLFFFIFALNLFGQIPFLGGANVTGNLSVTLVLAVLAFIVTTINGNGHYWKHILWMPGVPLPVKLIITPVEIMGIFIKPLTLMLRLCANIVAGHMVLVIFVGLIFIFGEMGTFAVGGWGAVIPSALLTFFMMAIELLVAGLQAFVFTILTASYIGAAVEDVHH